MSDRRENWSRREFARGLTVAATTGLLGFTPRRGAAEPPPETTRLRLAKAPQRLLPTSKDSSTPWGSRGEGLRHRVDAEDGVPLGIAAPVAGFRTPKLSK